MCRVRLHDLLPTHIKKASKILNIEPQWDICVAEKGVTLAPVAVVRTTWLLVWILIPDCPFLFPCQLPPWWQDGKCASTMRCFGRSDPFCWYITDVWLQNVKVFKRTRKIHIDALVSVFCEADDFEKVMVTARNLSGHLGTSYLLLHKFLPCISSHLTLLQLPARRSGVGSWIARDLCQCGRASINAGCCLGCFRPPCALGQRGRTHRQLWWSPGVLEGIRSLGQF